MTTSDNTQTELSFSNLAKEGLTLVDAKGRTIVPSSYQSDPNKLASILPASHPAIKSYDGDFITKEKLKKNYVAIPQNSIPIFNVTDPNKLEQKKVKAADGEPTVKTVFKDESDTCLKITFDNVDNGSVARTLWSYMNENYKDYSLLIADKNHSGNWYEGSNTEAGEDKILKTENTQSFSFQKSITKDTEEKFNQAFASELGMGGATYISKMNRDLGLKSYTAYNQRKFQFNVTWNKSQTKIQNRALDSNNQDVEYVSNAKQLITALLKHAKVNSDYTLESDANIMLLNDIDLDEMLQDQDGNSGLKEFIEGELESIFKKNNYSCTDGITIGELGKYYAQKHNKIDTKDETQYSQSGINFSVLSLVWQRYFGDDTKHDKFNEDFTNFIQIDNFTGAIGGGGFAINNLKMDTKDAQFAGMFGTLNNALLDGIWMENAQVLSSDNKGENDHNAAILAKNLEGQSWVNVSATGQQFTINSRSHDGSGTFSTKEFLKF